MKIGLIISVLLIFCSCKHQEKQKPIVIYITDTIINEKDAYRFGDSIQNNYSFTVGEDFSMSSGPVIGGVTHTKRNHIVLLGEKSNKSKLKWGGGNGDKGDFYILDKKCVQKIN